MALKYTQAVVLDLAGMQLTFFIAANMVLCLGLWLKQYQ